ncbi:MAG: transglutaminase family protein [Litorimonas sp.]
MRLSIRHETVYRYDAPVDYALLQLRVRPRDDASLRVVDWTVELDGAVPQARFADHYGNPVDLVEIEPQRDAVSITVAGTVETSDRSGVSATDPGPVPLWLLRRATDLTKADAAIRDIAESVTGADALTRLHQLSASIRAAVAYVPGETGTETSASAALSQGQGVCQDHAHIFLAAARSLGHPARYVGGYLMMDDRTDQDAGHAWAEAHVDGLGWVGFDVSNGISPDERYVAVARGLDYRDCAPTRGVMYGGSQEALEVRLQVQQ